MKQSPVPPRPQEFLGRTFPVDSAALRRVPPGRDGAVLDPCASIHDIELAPHRLAILSPAGEGDQNKSAGADFEVLPRHQRGVRTLLSYLQNLGTVNKPPTGDDTI